MAANLGSPDGDSEIMSAINTTPLVDIMLVLLIIFLLTIPVVAHVVPVRLPKEVNEPYEPNLQTINISITQDGHIFWNQEWIEHLPTLLTRLKEISTKTPQPEVHIRGDQESRYEFIGKVVITAKRAGINKVGFILEPPPKNERSIIR